MKTKQLAIIGFLSLLIFSGCSPEDDIKLPQLNTYFFYEEFLSNTNSSADINIPGWTNFAQAGTRKWRQGIYSGKKYAEFTAFGATTESSNIGWLITAPINMDQYEHETLAFDVAQAYVTTTANSIELLVSTDYDGTNVLGATWTSIPFKKPPLAYETRFQFFSSGLIDLSQYTGNIHLAFRYRGAGNNSTLRGTYQIDNIRIFDKK